MEQLISELTKKVGISEDQAKQVVEFLKSNADKLPEWLGGGDLVENLKDKLPGGLGGMLG